MVSDSDADDFEDASEFGVDDSEMFGLGSSTCRKAPMSKYYSIGDVHFRSRFCIEHQGHASQSLTIKPFFFTVPENSENEADALLHFTAEFSSR